MLSARFWLVCGISGVVVAACGSGDGKRTAPGHSGGEGGEPAPSEAGAPPTSGTAPVGGNGGAEPAAQGGVGGFPEGGAAGTPSVVEGGAGAGPEPLTLLVEPKYPTNGPYWLDYVKNDGATTTTATDAACVAATDGPLYTACVHGGEVRRVALPSVASCTGIAASDTLGAFDWICQATGSGVELVSTGLHQGKHMSDLLDFSANAWKKNSVTLTRDDAPLASSEPAIWWENSIKRLAGASCTADVGAEHSIFLLDAASSNGICTGATGKIGLATVPGETVADFRFAGRGGFNWFEGQYTLQAQYNGLAPGNGGFQVVRNASFTAANAGNGIAGAITMGAARASVVRDITATGGRIIIGATGAAGLRVSNVTSTGARLDAISFNSCSDCAIVGANISDTLNHAIYVQGVNPRLLVQDVVAADNVTGAISLSQVTDGRVENIKVGRAGAGGVVAGLTARTTFKSIFVDGAVGVGVSVDQGDDNRLVDIHVANAGANGVFLGGNRAVLQHARISCGKGQSITTGNGVHIPSNTFNGRMQDVTTASCRYGIDMNGSANMAQAVTVAATEDVGVRVGSYAAFVEDAVAIDTSYGIYFLSQVFTPPRIRNFASSHNFNGSVYSNNSTVDFAENLIVGFNGATGTSPDCVTTSTTGLDNACTGSTAALAIGKSVLNSIVGLTADATNPNGASGSASYATIVSFLSFDSETRRFVRAGTGFPDYSARGPCQAPDTCAILDLALKSTDTLLKNRNALPTGNDVTTQVWFVVNSEPADQAACDARVPGSVFIDDVPNHCDSVFLKHAWELLDDGIGDNDGLCESGETCEVARNIGGYQGHGPLVSAGAFTPGILTGITLVQRQTNGY